MSGQDSVEASVGSAHHVGLRLAGGEPSGYQRNQDRQAEAPRDGCV
jgi:hypothetical protein